MIIENPRNRPPKAVFRPLWKCPFCDRTMIFEWGINRWCGFFMERKTICFDCNKEKYTDAVHGRK